jgi:predicted PurR-regulated permease PerM
MGVIISFIPLSIIAFNIGGVTKVIAVVILIILIHTMETYILNPKLMADKTKLPVCFIFIVLIVGEHFLGTWGLLIGVPIFIFLLDIMDIKYIDLLKISKKN